MAAIAIKTAQAASAANADLKIVHDLAKEMYAELPPSLQAYFDNKFTTQKLGRLATCSGDGDGPLAKKSGEKPKLT